MNFGTAAQWNLIAQHQPETAWGKAMFQMTGPELDNEVDRLTEKLEADGVTPRVARAYLTAAPLLAEREAIQAAVNEGQVPMAVFPEILDLAEAATVAEMEYHLMPEQKAELVALLNRNLTQSLA